MGSLGLRRLLVLFSVICLVNAVNYEKTHVLTSSWAYAGRFCFEENKGRITSEQFTYYVSAPVDSDTKLLFYFNKANSPKGFDNFANDVYDSELTCQQRVAAADFIIYLNADRRTDLATFCERENKGSNCLKMNWKDQDRDGYDYHVSRAGEDQNGETLIFDAAGTHDFVTQKDRWFFVAIANCKIDRRLMVRSEWQIPPDVDEACDDTINDFCDSPIRAWLRLEFRNGEKNEGKNKRNIYYQISADEQDILPADIAFFLLQSLLLAYVSYVSCLLVAQVKWHYTVRLLVVSIFFQWFGIMFEMIYYSHLSFTGTEERSLQTTGLAFTAIAEQLFLFMLILVAKGWTIVRAKISASGRMKLAAYMTIYSLINFAMIGWWHENANSAAVVYLYDSDPGKVLVIMRVFAFIWFVYCCQTTATNYDKKKGFYSKFQICFGLWILSMPIFAAIALLIDDHTRQEFMNISELFLLFFAQAVLAYMYNPRANCNQSFPFHASTNDLMKPKRHRRERSSVEETTAQTVGAAGSNSDDGTTRPKLHSSHPGSAQHGGVRFDSEGADRVRAIAIVLQKKLNQIHEYAQDLIAAVQDLEQEDFDEDFDDMDNAMRSRPRVQRDQLPQGFQAPETEMQTYGQHDRNRRDREHRTPADEWSARGGH